MDRDKLKFYLKESLLAFSILMILVIVFMAFWILSFWGSGTYYHYSTEADILLEPDNSTIQNSLENFNSLVSNIENAGFNISSTDYNITKSYYYFHRNNVNLENDVLWGEIIITNESIHLNIRYDKRLPGVRSNESFQSLFENDTQMLKPYNEIIATEITNIYNAVVINESFKLVEGAIAVD